MRPSRLNAWMLACLFTVQLPAFAWAAPPVGGTEADGLLAAVQPAKSKPAAPKAVDVAYPDAVSRDYALAPGDTVSIHLWGINNDLNHLVTVNPQGSIYVPRIGEIHVAGKTTQQIESTLRQQVNRLVPGTQLLVLLTQGRPINVFVYGQVNHPGPVPYRANMRLSDTINAAGGPTGQAWLHNVKITRAGHGKPGPVIDVNANNILNKGRFDQDPQVGANDIVFIPEAFLSLNNFKELSGLILGGLGVVGLLVGVFARGS
ncbi:MAG: polysaccharide export protein [Candidatus Sericytochromatia bacterium]|nr:polysaccharide export protein [Candidatus Sericytochromatia bacterium]